MGSPSSRFTLTDDFWSTDFSMSYLLPRRLGKVSLGIANALDRRFPVVDSNDDVIAVPPERVLFARVNLSF